MDYESAAHLAPTPSYALESSDGESDYEDELLPSSRVTRKPAAPPAEVEVTFSGPTDKLKATGEAVFLVGEAGERMAQGVALPSSGEEAVSVLVDGEQVRPSGTFVATTPFTDTSAPPEQAGLIATATDRASCTLVFLSTALPLAALYPLAARVLELLRPNKVTVIASYHLPSYIPPSATPTPPLAIAPPVLYLASPSPSPTVAKLASNGSVQPFKPPNLLHGLPAALMTLSSTTNLAAAANSTLWLLPTTTTPPPLNGPFPPTSPITNHGGSASSMYDAGGPTGLGEPNALFRQVAGSSSAGGGHPLQAIKELESWSWWDPSGHGGQGFGWLERQRKQKRRSELSSMYM